MASFGYIPILEMAAEINLSHFKWIWTGTLDDQQLRDCEGSFRCKFSVCVGCWRSSFVHDRGKSLLSEIFVSSTGDDVSLLMAHNRGVDDFNIHELAWDAFMAGTTAAREQACTVRVKTCSRILSPETCAGYLLTLIITSILLVHL